MLSIWQWEVVNSPLSLRAKGPLSLRAKGVISVRLAFSSLVGDGSSEHSYKEDAQRFSLVNVE